MRLMASALFAGLGIVFCIAACSDKEGPPISDEPDQPDWVPPTLKSRTFTNSADFDLGLSSGVSHDADPQNLQMNMGRTVFETPFIWIANSTDNTVTQIDTKNNTVMGTYVLEKDGQVCSDPSRTTVDANNDVWIGCRGSANAVKVSKEGQVLMIVQLEGIPRGMAIDAQGYLWVGCGTPTKNDYDPVYKIDGKTGQCILGNVAGCSGAPIMVPDWPYGASVDQRGYLWMLSNHHWTNGTLTKINTLTNEKVAEYKRTDGGCAKFYGLAIDPLGDIWTGNAQCNDVLKFNGETGEFIGGYLSGGSVTRGVAVDLDGNVWVANSGTNTATKIHGADGQILTTLNVGNHPIGVGVDAYGNVWVVNRNSNNVYKVNGLTTKAEIISVGNGPYTYSDMMGTALRTITLHHDNTAYWTVNFNSGVSDPKWEKMNWNVVEPGDSKIDVRYRCSSEEASLYSATWSGYQSGPGEISCPDLQWIQIEVRFTAPDLAITPILEDLAVYWES